MIKSFHGINSHQLTGSYATVDRAVNSLSLHPVNLRNGTSLPSMITAFTADSAVCWM